MRRQWLGLAIAVALAFGAGAAHALPIAVASHERRVAVEASAGAASDARTASEPAEGPAALDETATASGTGSSGEGAAAQASVLSAAAVSGTGDAGASAAAEPAGGFALADAETLYRIEFTATADASLRLVGSLLASAQGGADAFAFVELASLDTALDPLLLAFEAAPGESESFDAVAALQAGLSYRLTAFARAGADALDVETSSAAARFAFDLVAVPEPGTVSLFAAGLALLAHRRKLTRGV